MLNCLAPKYTYYVTWESHIIKLTFKKHIKSILLVFVLSEIYLHLFLSEFFRFVKQQMLLQTKKYTFSIQVYCNYNFWELLLKNTTHNSLLCVCKNETWLEYLLHKRLVTVIHCSNTLLIFPFPVYPAPRTTERAIYKW